MRIIRTTLLLAIFCAPGFAQSPAAQQTENQTLPERKRTVLDVAQIQIRHAETLSQQGQSLPVDAGKLGSQGIEIISGSQMVVKDGAIYLMLAPGTLIPMNGGGASGCVPDNPKNVGKLISVSSQTDVQQAPAKDPVKKN
jgi:hypothetical protein